jgi:hypothetical protein
MIASPRWLMLAYGFNIIILLPVCYNMLFGSGVARVFEGRVAESAGLRLLVGSLWSAILVGSIAGLVWPTFFAAILPVQVFYKTLWLITFVLPLRRAGTPIPVGISCVFAVIAITYPLIFWASTRG